MTVKEYIDAIVKLSDEHAEAVERLKKKLEGLLADMEEQHKQAEPLIKDEKVRKAVRAWAVAESEDCYYGMDDTTLKNGSGDHIEFWSRPFKDLTPYAHYTIAELCGEEEE